MKTVLLLVLLFPVAAFSQITVTSADFSDGGDGTWMSTTIDPLIDYSTTGPNVSWDFSNLQYQSQDYKEYFDLSSASVFVNFIFGAFANSSYQATNFASSTAIPVAQITTFLPVTITDIFQFSKNSSSAITSVGYAISVDGNEIPFKSDTIEKRYALPLNFGDSYASRGYSNIDLNPIYNGIWRQHRSRQSEVDGWGSITTPHGTFDALRVRHFIEESDSIFMDLGGFSTWIPLPIPDSYVYEWWANGLNEPVLRISTSLFGGNQTPTTIEYLDDYQGAGAGIEELTTAIQVFPNPTLDFLNIEGIDQAAYNVLSMDGKLLLEGSANGNAQIDVRSLNAGSYVLLLNSGNSIQSYSFVKK